MTVATCENSTFQCSSETRPYESSNNSSEVLSHLKDTEWSMLVGGEKIILSSRKRTFSLSVSASKQWTNAKFIHADNESGFALCATESGVESGGVSENATFIDSEIFFCDPSIGVLFWKEKKDTCIFTGNNVGLAAFMTPAGVIHPHKLRVEKVKIDTVETYSLIANGTHEVVEIINSTFTCNAPLYLVWPMPPSMGICLDPELKLYGFYDINAGGSEEGNARAMKEGGKDFYYPEWLQLMGVNKIPDVQDALERYYAYWLGDGDQPTTIMIPTIPPSSPRGNAIKDSSGRIVMSFHADKINVNRIYEPDPKDATKLIMTDISSLFLKTPIYPVGIV